ncbi:MAG TPA: cyclic nucleotide-binding domain-containing protein [Candidatus Limnocylindria bacterium]|nr:cyclic nucleotide-binding domain-containing protein [Candidatus Limnocylindria bacterium]
MELHEQLASVPLFAGLPADVRRRLAEIGKRRSFNPDDAIVREGETGTALYVILSGRARVEQDGRTLGELSAGDFFGELALIEEHRRTATVVATEPTECLLYPAWEFTSLLAEHPEVAIPIMTELIRRLHRREHHGA